MKKDRPGSSLNCCTCWLLSLVLFLSFVPLPSECQPTQSIEAVIDSLVEPHIKNQWLSGTILVKKGAEMVYQRSFGYANWELQTKNTASTRMGIGSITKPFTEIIIHQLAAAGKLRLDDPVEKYLNAFPRGPEGGIPTIDHLLNHRAGVPHRVTKVTEETLPLEAEDIVERIRSAGLLFEPGSQRRYSSAGYTCLARIIELIEQEAYGAVVDKRVFRPAGMTRAINETGFGLMPERADSYRLGSAGGAVRIKRTPMKQLSFLNGAGSVFATGEDLVRFIDALEKGTFRDHTGKSYLQTDAATWFGIAGRTNGFEASVDALPAEGLVFVFLANLQSASNWQIREQIRQILQGNAPVAVPLPPPVAPPFEDPDALVGTFGSAEITLVHGDLFRGDNEFYPIDGQMYYIPVSGTRMRFRRDLTHQVDALVNISPDGGERILLKDK